MIDIHMLTLPTDNPAWKQHAISLVPTWATLHIIDAEVGPIGPQRLAAFRLGTHPYVSCIDPDDWTEPNTFDRCLDALTSLEYDAVCTQEMIHDIAANKVYLCPFKHKTFVFRREFMEAREALYRYDMLDKEIVSSPEVIQLPFIGHHWRKYRSAGSKQRAIRQGQ